MAFDPTIQSPKKQTRPGVIYEDNRYTRCRR
jgi:hypothetical protein